MDDYDWLRDELAAEEAELDALYGQAADETADEDSSLPLPLEGEI